MSPTRLRDWAGELLFTTDLAIKLAPPGLLVDEDPGPALLGLPGPGRPTGWTEGAAASVRIPSAHALEEDGRAGRLLHVFANHELLALELMALMLLRFPEAPRAWRLGLARTIADEQRHMGLYLARAAARGIAPGEVPVNRFFWRCVADCPSPLDFNVRMALVFEQANLDFTRHYGALFQTAGDLDTTAVLAQVHADELRHVQQGLHWFRRMKPPEEGEWEAFTSRLAEPLSPSRAKAPGYLRADRERAGFEPAFIDRLELWSRSRGRPPVVWFFNPACEEEIARGRPGHRPNAAVQALAADLAPMLIPLTREDDLLLLPRLPAPAVLAELRRAGIALPELVETGVGLGDRLIDSVRPWGPSPEIAHQLRALHARQAPTWDPAWAPFFGKEWAVGARRALRGRLSADGLVPPSTDGQICRSPAEVEADLGPETTVLKQPLGSSGRGAERIRGAMTSNQRRWLDRVLSEQGGVVAEPWLDRLLDLSYHFDILEDGRIRSRGLVRAQVSARGQPLGFVLGAWQRDLDPELRRLLATAGGGPAAVQSALAALLAPVAEAGIRGPVGIDAFVARVDGSLLLRPLVELNPRLTMGRVALALSSRLAPGRVGWLAFTPAGGCWAPPQLDDQSRLLEGVLPLTDLGPPARSGAVLSVAETLSQARALVGKAPGSSDATGRSDALDCAASRAPCPSWPVAFTLANLPLAIDIAHGVYVFDNSVDGVEARLCARTQSGQLRKVYGPLPDWVAPAAQGLPLHPSFSDLRATH